MSDALSRLVELRDDPFRWARDWKERTGGKAVGFFCCYAPEEIIHAAGALPVRITGENRVTSKSGAHLQSYCCSLARTGLDMALTGDLEFLDGTVFVHTCDTMQRLSDIWRLNAGYAFHGDVVLPVRFEGDAALEYMREELASFRKRVSDNIGPVGDSALAESIRLYNRNRELLAELYRLRREDPGIIPSDEALWLVASSALIEKSEHNAMLEEALAGLKGSGPESDGKVRLFAAGSVMDQWDFLKMVEEVGGTIVDDDFCTGHRYFDAEVPVDVDPIEGIARRLTDRGSCPCKYLPSGDRANRLLGRIGESGARGAIFFQFKFCDPHSFDYPYIKKALDEEGIPSLHLEIEHDSVSTEQLRTRVEALLETIRGC
jgi:bzd-type benzoyl-CoA reductase N subunit